MKAGTYWIGDLCYVLISKWSEVCSLTIKGQEVLSGEFQMADGTEFAILKTLYGDGVYCDQQGRAYPVDSGTIGCVLLSSIDKENDKRLGNVVEFKEDFFPEEDGDGELRFGHVIINTGDEEVDDEEDDYDDCSTPEDDDWE